MSVASISVKIAFAISPLLSAACVHAATVSYTDVERWSLAADPVYTVDFWSAGWTSAGGPPTIFIHIVLPIAVTAVGMNMFAEYPRGLELEIHVNGQDAYTDAAGFWGIVSDEPIQTVDLKLAAPNAGYFLIGSISFGQANWPESQAADTPEATTLPLVGAGLIAIARRRISGRST